MFDASIGLLSAESGCNGRTTVRQPLVGFRARQATNLASFL